MQKGLVYFVIIPISILIYFGMEYMNRNEVPPNVESILHFKWNESTSEHILRDQCFWGRFYARGWPSSIQYFRSNFGSTPIRDEQRMILLDPIDACSTIQNIDEIEPNSIVIARRGVCPFGMKANIVTQMNKNVSTLLLVNNKPGLEHPQAIDERDIDLFVAMIPEKEGSSIIKYIETEELTGKFIPIYCNQTGISKCGPATKREEDWVNNKVLEGGFMTFFKSLDETIHRMNEKELQQLEEIPFLLGDYGIPLPTNYIKVDHVWDSTKSCENITQPRVSLKSTVNIFDRGDCSFYTKSNHSEILGGRVLVLRNTNKQELVRPTVLPKYLGLEFNSSTVVVDQSNIQLLNKILKTSTPKQQLFVKFRLDETVRW